jgi:membrane dipeptidase
MDLPRIRAGDMAGGFFAIFAPPDPTYDPVDNEDDLNPPPAGGLAFGSAIASTVAMLDLRDAIVAEAKGAVKLCHSVAEMLSAMAAGQLAWITHIEGAEAVAADLSNLDMFYERGLRSIGPVWSRPNIFGEGVPFRFPSSPDTGGGLTEKGRDLIKRCNELRIMIDLSHITEKGFWDVAKISNAPLVATHSNAHALSASSRNLTNEQLLAIGESKGMVGLNYATGFLREDGRWTKDTEPTVLIRHLEHMLKYVGEDCVGLGSDFDGARIPGFINDVSGVPNLVEAMRGAGFSSERIEKICWKNWLRVLEKTWGR